MRATYFMLVSSLVCSSILKMEESCSSETSGDFCLLPSLWWLFSWLILRCWKWRWHVPSKRRLTFNGLHGISQEIELFMPFLRIWELLGSNLLGKRVSSLFSAVFPSNSWVVTFKQFPITSFQILCTRYLIKRLSLFVQCLQWRSAVAYF
jgi:hypothetical protein